MSAVSHNPVEKIVIAEPVQVSVVIPHFFSARGNNLKGLLDDLREQTIKEMEVLIVKNISPQGKAINRGVRETRGEILVIIDDDSRLGHSRVIENLVRALREDPSIGMAGASIITAKESNWFRRTAAKQFPRYEMAIAESVVDSDLPGHPCAAFPKHVFIQVEMEREDILRGLDPDLRVRIRKAGFRVVLAPQTWAYHPLPDSLPKFVRVFLRNGYGSAYLQLMHPEINYDTDEAFDSKGFRSKRSFFYRIFRYPLRLIKSLVTLQWLRLLGYSVYLIGYLGGLVRFSLLRPLFEKNKAASGKLN